MTSVSADASVALQDYTVREVAGEESLENRHVDWMGRAIRELSSHRFAGGFLLARSKITNNKEILYTEQINCFSENSRDRRHTNSISPSSLWYSIPATARLVQIKSDSLIA